MSDYIENKTEDLSWEHTQHPKVQEGCSSCRAENLVIGRESASEQNDRLLNSPDGSSPWDKDRFGQ